MARRLIPIPNSSQIISSIFPRGNISGTRADNVPKAHGDELGSDNMASQVFEVGNEKDLIEFKITDIINDISIPFRCTVNGISHTSSPVWNESEHVGRPYPIYFYKGVSRSVSFGFRVYAAGLKELPIMWNRINYIEGLTHPSSYTRDGHILPPYTKFTIGNLYNNQPSFISAFSFTIPDEAPWETGISVDTITTTSGLFRRPKSPTNRTNYIDAKQTSGYLSLPRFVDISMTFNIIEESLMTPYTSLFGFDIRYVRDIQAPSPDQSVLGSESRSIIPLGFAEDNRIVEAEKR